MSASPTDTRWHDRLGRAWQRSKSHPVARYAQLATVDGWGKPRNRTVVIRRLELERDELILATDFRSAKADHVEREALVELCWYFAGLREQFRLHGALTLVGQGHERAAERLALWRSMSPRGLAVFAWPEPGTERTDDDDFPELHSGPEPPAHFAMAALRVDEVDWLSLRGAPHERLRYDRNPDDSWRCRRVRP